MDSVARALVELAPWVRCVRSYVAALETAIAYCVVVCRSAAAFAYMQQQAAARTRRAWVSGLCQGKGVRTGGRLHPGQAGERLLKQCDLFLVPVRLAPGEWLRATLSCAFGSHGGKLTA